MGERIRIRVEGWVEYEVEDHQALSDAASLTLHEISDPREELRKIPSEYLREAGNALQLLYPFHASLLPELPGARSVDKRLTISAPGGE